MQHVRFGRTGLRVSELNLGTMTFGSPVDSAEAGELLDVAYEAGVNFFDTANMYNAGASEEILGGWLTTRKLRDKVLVSSKVRYPIGGDPTTAGLSSSVVHRQVDASLKRLNTDYLDVLFLHQPDDDTPIDVTLRAVDDLTRSGRVRTVGLSNFAAWQSVQAISCASQNGWNPPSVAQPMYNLVSRSIETEYLPMARAYDIATCVYNPLAGGLLTEKQLSSETAVENTRLATNQYYRNRYWHPSTRKAAKELLDVAREYGRSLPELAIRFLLDCSDVSTVLIGATSLSQLKSSLRVAEAKPLSQDEKDACDSVWKRLVGPIPRYCRTNEDAKMH